MAAVVISSHRGRHVCFKFGGYKVFFLRQPYEEIHNKVTDQDPDGLSWSLRVAVSEGT
jgi:hypothetical protein